jgi:hypothetical protein
VNDRARRKLGSWTCPSGNGCDVFFRRDTLPGLEHLDFEWDEAPPLAPPDRLYYLVVILPAVHRRCAELKEEPVRQRSWSSRNAEA